jgi:Domain of unknown function (DUF4865)
MIAMQYSFTLPADYDMEIIDRRIRDKGPLLDGFPMLGFKAYLSARKQGVDYKSAENLYAPFYLWREPEGIDRFLSSPGFAALTRDFGWPSVKTWLIWHADQSADLRSAKFATRAITAVAPHSDLAARRDSAIADARAATKAGALAAIAGFDPTGWKAVAFHLWSSPSDHVSEATQIYSVGHISLP